MHLTGLLSNIEYLCRYTALYTLCKSALMHIDESVCHAFIQPIMPCKLHPDVRPVYKSPGDVRVGGESLMNGCVYNQALRLRTKSLNISPGSYCLVTGYLAKPPVVPARQHNRSPPSKRLRTLIYRVP
eukprot:364639-Chlamydomonas_euryale.AAC.18